MWVFDIVRVSELNFEVFLALLLQWIMLSSLFVLNWRCFLMWVFDIVFCGTHFEVVGVIDAMSYVI